MEGRGDKLTRSSFRAYKSHLMLDKCSSLLWAPTSVRPIPACHLGITFTEGSEPTEFLTLMKLPAFALPCSVAHNNSSVTWWTFLQPHLPPPQSIPANLPQEPQKHSPTPAFPFQQGSLDHHLQDQTLSSQALRNREGLLCSSQLVSFLPATFSFSLPPTHPCTYPSIT